MLGRKPESCPLLDPPSQQYCDRPRGLVGSSLVQNWHQHRCLNPEQTRTWLSLVTLLSEGGLCSHPPNTLLLGARPGATVAAFHADPSDSDPAKVGITVPDMLHTVSSEIVLTAAAGQTPSLEGYWFRKIVAHGDTTRCSLL